MCDCCDPTSDSPDPVVVRLERRNEELRNQLADAQCQLVASHPEAWANITKRLTDERDTLRGLLREAVEDYSDHNAACAATDRVLAECDCGFFEWYERVKEIMQ